MLSPTLLRALLRVALADAREASALGDEEQVAHLCHLADALESEAWVEDLEDTDA
jgi:hypothetical protein